MSRILRVLRHAVVYEVKLYRALLRWVTRRPDVPVGATAFTYVKAVAVLLWAFVIVSAIEVVALELILPWETVRLIALVLGLWGLVWMLGLTASYHVYPHLVDAEGIRVRDGVARDIRIPWDAVGSLRSRERSRESSKAVQLDEAEGASVLHLVTSSRTNVDVVLSRPLAVPVKGRTVEVVEIRFFADEPRALVTHVRERSAATG